MKIIANSILLKIKQDKCYFSNEIEGNFIILTTKDKAMRFDTEEEAKRFIKKHKVDKNTNIILDCDE